MNQRKLLAFLIGALAVLAAAALVTLTAMKLLQFRNETKTQIEAAEASAPNKIQPVLLDPGAFELDGVRYPPKKRVMSYLILGMDRTQEQLDRGMNAQADVLLLVVLDGESQTYQILQINRDTETLVTILNPDDQITDSVFMPVCLAQGFGSTEQVCCENTVRAVRYLLSDVEIDGYFALNLNAIEAINDAVGGVTVKIDSDMTSVNPDFVKGATVTLDQSNVEVYVRSRMSLGDDNNMNRLKRQRTYLSAWLAKASDLAGKDPGFLLELLDKIKAFSVTDLTDKRLSNMASTMDQYENLGFVTIEGENIQGLSYNEFYADSESIRQVLLTLFYTAETIE